MKIKIQKYRSEKTSIALDNAELNIEVIYNIENELIHFSLYKNIREIIYNAETSIYKEQMLLTFKNKIVFINNKVTVNSSSLIDKINNIMLEYNIIIDNNIQNINKIFSNIIYTFYNYKIIINLIYLIYNYIYKKKIINKIYNNYSDNKLYCHILYKYYNGAKLYKVKYIL